MAEVSSECSPSGETSFYGSISEEELKAEVDSRWILNLSLQHRDRSDREKFFVTYIEKPNQWRRVTISCDYRDAEEESLESDLRNLQFQREKSALIYEYIRDSLPEMQFYETVTNWKLKTTDGRLHIHVTGDVDEIIHYPQTSAVSHILESSVSPVLKVREADIEFDSHLSRFVYTVRYKGAKYIRKDVPGPDTIDEFLSEINAVHGSNDYPLHLEAIVVDASHKLIKGILLSHDYDSEVPTFSWESRRRHWAEQAVQGISQIHEEGYLQGAFTLSNLVGDRAKGAGWNSSESPQKIASDERISTYTREAAAPSTMFHDLRRAVKAPVCRRGRGQRRNKVYWNSFLNTGVLRNPFERDCLFETNDGSVSSPAISYMESECTVPCCMSMTYLRELGLPSQMSIEFEDPGQVDIGAGRQKVKMTGIVRNVSFRIRGSSMILRGDFPVSELLDSIYDVLFGWQFMCNEAAKIVEMAQKVYQWTKAFISMAMSSVSAKIDKEVGKFQRRVSEFGSHENLPPPPPYSLVSVFRGDHLTIRRVV